MKSTPKKTGKSIFAISISRLYLWNKDVRAMNYTIKIDHPNKLIHYAHFGKIKTEDIGKAWDEFLTITEFTEKGYNLFSNYTEATFDMNINEVDTILSELEKLIPVIKNKKQALLIKGSFATAASLYFQEKVFERTHFNVKSFSTHEAAFSWLTRT